jgi:orotate phosphoribosyltransferase
MHLVPTQEEVIQLLKDSGALREGHFEYPNGLFSDQYLQVPLAFRHSEHARTLSVSLSRLVRAHTEIRALVPELSIVTPATGGLPVAFGVCEALRAKQVYWAERENENQPLRFRQFLEVKQGDKVLLVDDILRTGQKLTELRQLVERMGGEVVGLAVIVYQPTPTTPDFSPLPFFYLAKLDAMYFADAEAFRRKYPNQKITKIWI